jgi:hypothetical protein
VSSWIDLAALGRILVASLLAGAGLTLVFSLGLVGVSEHSGRMRGGAHVAGRRGASGWLVLAGLCFAVVVAGIAIGVWAMTQK